MCVCVCVALFGQAEKFTIGGNTGRNVITPKCLILMKSISDTQIWYNHSLLLLIVLLIILLLKHTQNFPLAVM